jgi:hypothetical protein
MLVSFWLFTLAATISLVTIELFAEHSYAGIRCYIKFVYLVRWIVPVVLMHAYIYFKGVLNGYRQSVDGAY